MSNDNLTTMNHGYGSRLITNWSERPETHSGNVGLSNGSGSQSIA